MATDDGRALLLAALDIPDLDLDGAAQQRAETAIEAIEWSDDLDRTVASESGRRALLRGVAFGFERHGPAAINAIVRDHTRSPPERGISTHPTIAAEVDAARQFLIAEFGRVRGRAMELMFAAVDEAVATTRPLTLAERNFLDHELLEAAHVAAGSSQRDAHLMVHEVIPPGANFSPHVLVELHDYFGPENFLYWGLTK